VVHVSSTAPSVPKFVRITTYRNHAAVMVWSHVVVVHVLYVKKNVKLMNVVLQVHLNKACNWCIAIIIYSDWSLYHEQWSDYRKRWYISCSADSTPFELKPWWKSTKCMASIPILRPPCMYAVAIWHSNVSELFFSYSITRTSCNIHSLSLISYISMIWAMIWNDALTIPPIDILVISILLTDWWLIHSFIG